MKFTISYKFKLKMAQNLSGRSIAGRSRPGPVRCRSVPLPVPVPPVPIGAGAADRPQETLYTQKTFFWGILSKK